MTKIMMLFSATIVAIVWAVATGQTTPPEPPRWVFEQPPSQDTINRQYVDVGTLVMKVGQDYLTCWSNPVRTATGAEETNLQITHRRYRVEGGPMMTGTALPFPKWLPKKDALGAVIPFNYCAKMPPLPRAGHWVTEAQMCLTPYVSDAESCSAWMSGIQQYNPVGGGGTVGAVPQGWWIYAYIPAPSGVGT